jgi:hypothetical protein
LSKAFKKRIDNLNEKLISFEARHSEIVNPDGKVMEETETQKLARFARMKEARAKKTNAFGNKTYEDVWDNMTEEEEEYYRQKRREVDPAVRYQREKEEWWFHDLSYVMRNEDEVYDGWGCTGQGCDPRCRYYAPTGEVTFEEVEQRLEEYKKKNNDKKKAMVT